jgi:demethylmenaquinone methyltransferase/2-methoxy-6-polyprenyl-1,4-benzoquinol methylase
VLVVRDQYARLAQGYDAVIEPLIRDLRAAGRRLSQPRPGMAVLDVGCGTGSHLADYQDAGCWLFGIDLSSAMLQVARTKLAGQAALQRGDAARMPYADGVFDLAQVVFVFHEMPPPARALLLGEIARVLREDGRLLVIDYHVGPVQFPAGWQHRVVITLMEHLAGREHSRNYRDFVANGGLSPLASANGLWIEEQWIVGGGTLGLYLLARSPVPAPAA